VARLSSSFAGRRRSGLFSIAVARVCGDAPVLGSGPFDFDLTDDEMARIAALDTGTSLFFDHRDPAQVSRLGTARIAFEN
jgi:hypothetical protein